MSTINNKNKDLTTERRVYPQVRYSSLRYFPFFLIHHREYCSFDWINLGTFCWCSISSCCNLVHGGWSKWSGWTSCTKSCGTGSQERFRGCTNPRPKYGGRLCTGQTRDKRNCNKKQCPGKIQMWLHLVEKLCYSFMQCPIHGKDGLFFKAAFSGEILWMDTGIG